MSLEDKKLNTQMKGLSLFFLKNSMGANMKKSFRNSCNRQASTSTLPTFSVDNSTTVARPPRKSVTLEEMILQLELEEELARRAPLLQHGNHRDNNIVHHRRKSSVNNSDILRSARNALSPYPRFSLDGKGCMYRSSFRKIDGKESLVRVARRSGTSTSTLGGESIVVWCKPGVVAKLMGLETMPVPVPRRRHNHNHNHNNKRKTGCKEEGVPNPWQPTHAFL